MKFGAHMSVSGGVCNALERGASVGCEVVQIFVKNNMQWFAARIRPPSIAQFKREEESGFGSLPRTGIRAI